MAIVLQPILKTNSVKGVGYSSPRVTFNLPSDQGMIQYLQSQDNLSHSSKLHSIVKLLSANETDDYLIIKWLTELKDNISFLNGENEKITHTLLNIPWYTKDEVFINAYREFILNLITARTSYAEVVLSKFINILLLESEIDNTNNDLKRVKCIHHVLKNIFELVPNSQHEFCVKLTARFPYIRKSASVFLNYVQNVLRVCSYLPTKRSYLLECVIEKLIHIDVLCPRETITYHEEMAEDNNELMESLDTEAPADAKVDEMAYDLAHTLDVLLDCLFKYIKTTCFEKDSDKLDWETTKKIYKEILTIFDKIILPTQGCHVQFIMFFVCSLKQDLCDGFLDYLWKKVKKPEFGFIPRQLAAFYIGSLLSRAKYISIDTVKACFTLMSDWLHKYINEYTHQDAAVHGIFHSVCQAMFYVFAFRIKELMEMPNGYNFLRSLNFNRIVTSRLNPLKYCDRTIVQNFASTARNHQVAYVYPVIERNNRNLLYSTLQNTDEPKSNGAMIKTMFPFDPYLLKRSKHWVEPHFRIYNHSHKDEDIADQPEEDMDVSEELFSYSCSPGFKRIHSRLKELNS